MKQFIYALISLSMIFLFTNGTKYVVGVGQTKSVDSLQYISADVDTFIWKREGGVSAASLALYHSDTINITNIIVHRKSGLGFSPVLVGDTLTSSDSSKTAATILKSFTLTPLADEYLFIIKYATNTGGYNQSVDSNYAVVEVIKQYAK